ncbi:hypothetical protein Rvan_3120 [Rhodomicrobium vannielii ATCC 17100]|uniref:Uncharacterized protein n=1 Tax=Rhodomicrobium vannielii (strain ATCC 17100 / DSM 162 / LMG 4299 / NCIMB 10020 / ATH 3.1.1) TaxID=648757 RepID=E3I0Z9_RHOVT|nr:hypothetical protein [Rhodomicrobium vannielii]ADP72322.1 hypothetical protein Rvan_3120 [Rhodomicrobium vannielii ATCC 17100]
MPRFVTLDETEVIKSAYQLKNRVAERFPDRGLTREATRLAEYAHAIAQEAHLLAKRNVAADFVIGALTMVGFAVTVFILARIPWIEIQFAKQQEFFQAMQGVSAAIHVAVSVALVIFFVTTRATRMKRKKALRGLHSLRAFAHVVDSHQMNKDPAAMAANLPPTRSSPDRDLSPRELLRYLEYCSEMLSLISKFAALYAQSIRDPVIFDAVNDIEQLTASLSNKIWQKIMILHGSLAREPHSQQIRLPETGFAPQSPIAMSQPQNGPPVEVIP